MKSLPIMKEHKYTPLGRVVVLLLTFYMAVTAILNISKGRATNPYGIVVIFAGLACFSAAKISVFSKGLWITFGTRPMTEGMANLYRVGYWLMVVGVLLTFMKY